MATKRAQRVHLMTRSSPCHRATSLPQGHRTSVPVADATYSLIPPSSRRLTATDLLERQFFQLGRRQRHFPKVGLPLEAACDRQYKVASLAIRQRDGHIRQRPAPRRLEIHELDTVELDLDRSRPSLDRYFLEFVGDE